MAGFGRTLFRIAHARWSLVRRAMTFGVRTIVIEDGRVLLVRHGYDPGWHLPGGGVDLGETAAEASARELMEETGVESLAPHALIGLYFNPVFGGRNHVALFNATRFQRGPEPALGREIAERGWFLLDALPDDATPATRRRLNEFEGKSATAARW